MVTLNSPLRIGLLDLKHRVVMAPMTRNRADDHHVPLDMVREYYAQRASTPGTLLISEGTFISERAGGMENVPGIWNNDQITQWKTVTDAVHAKGSYIYCQLWALGRAARIPVITQEGHEVISSSDVPMSDSIAIPRPLTEEEILGWIEDYARAAQNAIAAGFDGVEIHGANGYLCDQFLQDTCNKRTDRWGGSIENRSRFGFEVAKAVAAAVGPERTGYRISPWSHFQDMRMDDLEPQFEHLAHQLNQLGLAYLHVVEPRISGGRTVVAADEDSTFLFEAFKNGAIILAGGFTAKSAETVLLKHPDANVAIGFGRQFLANPDLPFRIAKGLNFNAYDRGSFYTPKSPVGFTDYPFSSEYLACN
ncbi:NADPH dehydrogenase [Penicillium macrosclerotiorum]|uniref:NADPH dehydrogenase n=1 Tax=Penicillium macrosclerotiorum TaxID=303699 RepID=UPI002547013C|nr:NADPH dehydrogenase [Penicillium macrosclerotiorum]KAJ5683448.1 NADPH dehydrogenase [Penicillium macrosclerotiorum]